MSIYIALLRGINVGGRNKIKMADLRTALTEAGLHKVQTYIQSGNVLFESAEAEAALTEKIESKIKDAFGISLTVVLRTVEELERITVNCPFPAELVAEVEANARVEVLYVAMLPEAPSEDGAAKLAEAHNGDDEYRIVGRDVYMLFRQSIRDSKLAVQIAKLGVPATVRNWNTMNKLVELACEMSKE